MCNLQEGGVPYDQASKPATLIENLLERLFRRPALIKDRALHLKQDERVPQERVFLTKRNVNRLCSRS